MGMEVPVEVLPKAPIPPGEEHQHLPCPRFPRGRLALAFTVATLADGLSFFLTFTPPEEWANNNRRCTD